MKYALVNYENPAAFDSRDGAGAAEYWDAWRAYTEAIRAAEISAGGEALQPPALATVVRLNNGVRHVQDGPYADTREQMGGFIILDVPTLDDALDWAAKCPAAAYGAVEVRPVLGMDE